MPNDSNVTKNEETTGFRKLHSLVEANAFSDLQKRIGEIRKRVEKLYSAERSKLLDKREARVREEEERRAEIEAEQRANAEPETIESAEPEVPAHGEKTEAADSVAAPEIAPQATTPTVPESKPTAAPEVVQSTTRTAIPSYIKGVVKHTPRPDPRPRTPNRDRNATVGAPRTGAPRPQGGAPRSAPATRLTVPKFEAPAATARKRNEPAGKKAFVKPEDKRQMSKRMLIRKGYIQEDLDEERMGTRKLKNKKVNKIGRAHV